MRRFPFNTYINFGLKGSRAEREQFAGSLYTALYAGAAHTNTLAWISNSAVYADIISTVINNSMIQNWCAQNEEHAEELCAEILAFIDSVDNYLERETAPCETERALCRELAALDQHDFIEAWPDIAGYLHQCYNGAVNIQFIAEELAKTRRRSAARHFKQVKDYLLARLQQLLDIEITAWYNNVFKTRGAVFLQGYAHTGFCHAPLPA